MSNYAYVYVGEQAKDNFNIGQKRMVWGWEDPHKGRPVQDGLKLLRDPGDDTYLVFAQEPTTYPPYSGWPRTKIKDGLEPWWRASFRSLVVAQVTGPLYTANGKVWPDASYPLRVDLRSIAVEPSRLSGRFLCDDALWSIRGSGVRRCGPVLGPDPFENVVDKPPEEPFALAPDRLLTGLDGLNGYALALVRREQSRLRAERLAGSDVAQCALCGRSLPAGLLRLAHIKKRSKCTPQECLDPDNTMWACTLGCDELFERGYISASNGKVVVRPDSQHWTNDLDSAVKPYLGTNVGNYSSRRESYFQWHRHFHGVSSS